MEDSFYFVGIYAAFMYFFITDIKCGYIVIVVLVGYFGVLGLFDGLDDKIFVFGAFFQVVDVAESPFAKGATGLVE